METTEISVCCRTEVTEDYKPDTRDKYEDIDIYICNKCKQECKVETVCADCLGTGEIVYDEDDGEGHLQRGVGTRKCNSSFHEPADFSGASGGER